MDFLENFIGNDSHHLLWWQVSLRAVLMFLAALVLIRIAGIRTFAKKSAIDHVTMFILGSVLARAITGAAPLLVTMLAGLVLVLLHRLMAFLTYKFKGLGRLVKGKTVVLYEKNAFCDKALLACHITQDEIIESVRKCLHTEDMSKVRKVYIEPGGEMNVLQYD